MAKSLATGKAGADKIDIPVDDWKARKPFIGASEAHKTLPNSEYQHTFWNEKVGNGEPPDISELPQIIRGNRIEQVMPDWIQEDYGMKIKPNTQTYISRKFPWAIATPDGFFKDKEGTYGIEEKAPSVFNANYGDPDTDQIPQYNLVQVHHTMAVMPELVGYYLFAWNENGLRRYIIKKDKTIETALMDKESRFMDFVKEKVPPPPRNEKDLIYHFFKSNKKYISRPSAQLLHDSNELYQLRKLNKENKEKESELRFKVQHGIGEHAGVEFPDGKKLRMDRISSPNLQFDTAKFKQENPDMHSKYCTKESKPYIKLVFPRD